jgi:hypothetical protein
LWVIPWFEVVKLFVEQHTHELLLLSGDSMLCVHCEILIRILIISKEHISKQWRIREKCIPSGTIIFITISCSLPPKYYSPSHRLELRSCCVWPICHIGYCATLSFHATLCWAVGYTWVMDDIRRYLNDNLYLDPFYQNKT